MNHVMQHKNSPTWCIHCGTFDIYCQGKCISEPSGKYNSELPGNAERIFKETFGIAVEELAEGLE